MKKAIYIILAVGVFFLLAGGVTVNAQQSQLPIKEMTVEVQSNIIELPGGATGRKIAKVPVKRTSVRNTELRELNRAYNVVSIERIFELVTVPVVKVAGDEYGAPTLKSQKQRKNKMIIGRKKEVESQKGKNLDPEMIEEVVPVNDIFILHFRDYMDGDGNLVAIDMAEVVAAYSVLSVVVSANEN